MALSDGPLDFGDDGRDLLQRLPTVHALQRLLASPALETPLVVGVYGGWGTGKTSVMRTLREALAGPERIHLWFDAWVYARQEQVLWRALLLRVVTALRERAEKPDGGRLQGARYDAALRAYNALWISEDDAAKARSALDEARDRLYRSMTVVTQGGVRVNWWGALPLAADAALTALTAGLNSTVAKAIAGEKTEGGVATALAKWFKGGDTKEVAKLIEREASEQYVEQVTSLEQFQELFRGLLDLFGIGKTRRLFVFVDDLDRCLPEDAVAALEAIKLFLDLEGCVFVLGMDREVVEQGIRVRYKDLKEAGFDARAYLDKIIQVPFNLPLLGPGQITAYLEGLQGPAAGAFAACADLFREVAPPNPRTLKRVLNCLLLALYLRGFSDADLANAGSDAARRDEVRRLAKIVLLQVCFGRAWWAVVDGRCSLRQAENIGRGRDTKNEVDSETRKLFEGHSMERLFRLDPELNKMSDKDLQDLISLTQVMQENSVLSQDNHVQKS
ncbi:P-loop NTPase fold protein [Dankookia sp. GCM10030260]|uniref:KAP family P-loop NTPase fold protein n=1 Tax=Dankookia sp. GCM10030260 TaxID=3273390 RepID=UPI00360EA71B